jgi:uncharacterized membrane protein HdeD (DUF308 family)
MDERQRQFVEEKLKRRMMWFYVAGLANLVLGMYILIQGRRCSARKRR